MFDIFFSDPTVTTAYSKIQKRTGTNVNGDFWNHTQSLFEAAPTGNEERIPLTGDGEGVFTGQTATLETYTGDLTVNVYDGSDVLVQSVFEDVILGLRPDPATLRMLNDMEARLTALIESIGGVTPLSTIQVASDRTWFLSSSLEARVAPQTLSLFASDLVTISMDWTDRLNPMTSLSSVKSVTDSLGLLTLVGLEVDQERKRAHVDVTEGLASGNRHELTIEVVTVDGQELSGKGVLVVQ